MATTSSPGATTAARPPLAEELTADVTRLAAVRGQWAVCASGRVGRILDCMELPWGLSWVGIGIDGTPWASRRPRLLTEADGLVLTAAFSSDGAVGP